MQDDKASKLSWLITLLGRTLWTTSTPTLCGIPDFSTEGQKWETSGIGLNMVKHFVKPFCRCP